MSCAVSRVYPSSYSALSSLSSFRLNLFITGPMPSDDEQLGGIGRPADRLGDRRPLVRLEPGQHVVRQIAPRVAAADADPQPRELVGAELLDDRLQPVVPARRSARPRARSRPSASCTSSTTTSRSGTLDLEEPQQLADRVAAEVHERQRLGEQHARRSRHLRHQRLGRRRLPLQPVPGRERVDDLEPDVVPGAGVLRARVAQPDNELQALLLFSSPSRPCPS